MNELYNGFAANFSQIFLLSHPTFVLPYGRKLLICIFNFFTDKPRGELTWNLNSKLNFEVEIHNLPTPFPLYVNIRKRIKKNTNEDTSICDQLRETRSKLRKIIIDILHEGERITYFYTRRLESTLMSLSIWLRQDSHKIVLHRELISGLRDINSTKSSKNLMRNLTNFWLDLWPKPSVVSLALSWMIW